MLSLIYTSVKETAGLRRQPTLPTEAPTSDPPRKILKAKRRLTERLPTAYSSSSILIKPSLSKKGSSVASMMKRSSLTKKASITKEISDIATTAISLDSGSHIGKTGVITEDDIGTDVDVTEVEAPASFSETGEVVVTALRTILSGTGSLTKKLSRKKSSRAAPVSSFSSLPPLPPGGLVEIAFSFDTTGSMSAALNEVKGRIKDIVQKLQSDVPGIRIAIFAHGDYCDKDNYIIKWIDFGATLPELHDFVNDCSSTGGGDGPECYELVLRRATEVLSWTPGSKRSLVIIGDDIPHEPGYKYGDFTNDINWRDECIKLKDMGVKVYGVAVKAGMYQQKFYKDIASMTDGLMITLDKFNLIFDLMMAICYREGGEELLKAYQEELKEKYGVSKLSKGLSGMFSRIETASGFGTTPGTSPFGTTSGTGIIGRAPGTGLFGTTPGTGMIGTAPGTGMIGRTPGTSMFGTTLGTGMIGTAPGTGMIGTAPGTGLFGTTPMTGTIGMNPMTGLFFHNPPGKGLFTSKLIGAKAGKLGIKTTKGRKTDGRENYIPREKKDDKKFKNSQPLNRLDWSSWKLAMSQINKNGEWTKWLNGYCTKTLFAKGVEDPAVYEFAIQPPSKKKKYVVAFNVEDSLPSASTGKWSKNLVRRKDLRDKFRQAVQQNASVYIRRGKFKKRNKKFMEKVRKHLENSNYAFGTSKKNTRQLKVKGFTLW